MTTCWCCGDEIEFPYVGGMLVLIHVSGGNYKSSTEYIQKNVEDFCRPATFPECGEDVFFHKA